MYNLHLNLNQISKSLFLRTKTTFYKWEGHYKVSFILMICNLTRIFLPLILNKLATVLLLQTALEGSLLPVLHHPQNVKVIRFLATFLTVWFHSLLFYLNYGGNPPYNL